MRWASVQAIDVKLSQDLTHQKSLKSVNFWQSYLPRAIASVLEMILSFVSMYYLLYLCVCFSTLVVNKDVYIITYITMYQVFKYFSVSVSVRVLLDGSN